MELAALLVSALLVILLGAMLALALIVLVRTQVRSERLIRSVVTSQSERIVELENRLMSHSWQEFSYLQQVPGAEERAAAVSSNGWGEPRSEEAYGETKEDLIQQELLERGIDLSGPTLG